MLVTQLCPKLYKPMDYNLPRLLRPWDSPGKNSGVVANPFPSDLPNPRIKPGSPELQADSLHLSHHASP